MPNELKPCPSGGLTMREILFRGKRKDNGEWVEGCGIIATENWVSIFTVIDDIDENSSEVNEIEVIPETVGQFTGLSDKNGNRIFEGDIVKTDKFSEPNKQYIIKYDLQFGAFIGQDRYNCYFVTFDGDSDEFEVIGNIHDSPELLKGGEEE